MKNEKELSEIKDLLDSFGKAQEEKLGKIDERIRLLEGREIKPIQSPPQAFPVSPNNQTEMKIEVIGDSSITPEQRQEFILRLRDLMREWKVWAVNMTFKR